MKIRSSPPARRPSKEESQRPAGQQADRKNHGEEGDYSAAQSLENSRRHEVVGGDEQQLIGQHADSMTGGTLTSGGRIAVSAMPLAPAQHQVQKSAFCRAETVRARLVLVASAGYTGLTGLTLWQALRGQPLIQPDGLTLLAGAVLVALVAAGAVAAMASDKLRRRGHRAIA